MSTSSSKQTKGYFLSLILYHKPSFMKRLLFLAMLFSVFLTSCRYVGGERIRGNGNVNTENRSVSSFTGIEVSGNAEIIIKQDSVYSVKVEADENLLNHIMTEVDGNTLEIYPRNHANLKSTRGIKVYISGPSIIYYKASGACIISTENKITSTEKVYIDLSGASDVRMELMAPTIEAELSGAGSIIISGQTKDFKVDGSGSTKIRCGDLLAENVMLDLSGASDAEVYASVKLDVEVSGAADVKYKGNATVRKDISGAGSVRKVD